MCDYFVWYMPFSCRTHCYIFISNALPELLMNYPGKDPLDYMPSSEPDKDMFSFVDVLG